jgi:hypothetical protein
LNSRISRILLTEEYFIGHLAWSANWRIDLQRYRVTFDSLATSVQIDGLRLQQDGFVIRLENVGMSELLLFEEWKEG